jgi:hypothetical protein
MFIGMGEDNFPVTSITENKAEGYYHRGFATVNNTLNDSVTLVD